MRYPCSLLILTLALSALPASAQTLPQLAGSDPGSSVRTRAELERQLGEYEEILASTAYSESAMESIRADADQIRARLENGDFQVGDRITLFVQGEPDLPDTVTVEPGPMVVLAWRRCT